MNSQNNDEEIPTSSSSLQQLKENQNMRETNAKSIIIMDKKEDENGTSDLDDKTYSAISISQNMAPQSETNSNLVNVHTDESQLLDTIEKQENSSGLNPLEMIDVVPYVLKQMDPSSLKSSLMVSHLWKGEGIKMFLEKNYVRVPYKLHDKADNDDSDDDSDDDDNYTPTIYSDKEKATIIEQVKDTLSNYKGVINLKIRDALDISLFQQVEMNREQVNEVKLSPLFYHGAEGDEDKIDPLNSSLFTFCPNMKILDTTLIFQSDFYELSIRLKFGTCLMYSCIEYGYGQEDKPLTLTHLSSVAMEEDQLMTLEQFVETGVKIKNFCLHFNSRYLEEDDLNLKAIEVTMKLLETSQNVLESYSFNGSDMDCSAMVDMPILPHLHTLTIDLKLQTSAPGVPIVFSPNFKFSINTPNLAEVSLSILPDPAPNDEKVLERIFEHTEKATSVRKLHYINQCERLETGRLFETFSEIEELIVDNGKIEWNNVWNNCRKLKSLELNVHIEDEVEGLEFLSTFLGISLKESKRIWSGEDQELNESKLISSSIHNLTELEDLTIILDHVFLVEFAIRVWDVIRDYAFDLPKIKRAQGFCRRTTMVPQEYYQEEEEDEEVY